jgi:GNAT superfamily N-acetyltransferase
MNIETPQQEKIPDIKIETLDVIEQTEECRKYIDQFIKDEEAKIDKEGISDEENLKRIAFTSNHTSLCKVGIFNRIVARYKENPDKVRGKLFLAKDNDKVLGIGLATIDEDAGEYKTKNYFGRLYDARGMNIPEKLLEEEIQYLKEQGIKNHIALAGRESIKIYDKLVKRGILSYEVGEYQNEYVVTIH